MDLHQLRCFVAAAEELHFGKAAHRLEMLPSALGRYIRLLEEDLGTRLMMRTTRSVALTEDGGVLLKEARSLLAQADGGGQVVINLPPTHQEIAIMVNTSRETVTRTLQFLQSIKVVARSGTQLVVHLPSMLQEAADGKVAPNKS